MKDLYDVLTLIVTLGFCSTLFIQKKLTKRQDLIIRGVAASSFMILFVLKKFNIL